MNQTPQQKAAQYAAIDINKPPGFYTYRNGEPARILCTDAPGGYPIISADDKGDPQRHTALGHWIDDTEESQFDLIESTRAAREWDAWVDENGGIHGPGVSGKLVGIRVREVLPASPAEPTVADATVEVPELTDMQVGNLMDFLSKAEEDPDGNIYIPKTEEENARSKREASVTIPEGFPPVVIPEGKIGINRGFGWKSSCSDYLYCHPGRGWTRQVGGFFPECDECFFIELIPAPEEGDSAPPTPPNTEGIAENSPDLGTAYPPPESEWRELGPDDGEEILTTDYEINARSNGVGSGNGWITACGIAVDVPYRDVYDQFRARRRVKRPLALEAGKQEEGSTEAFAIASPQIASLLSKAADSPDMAAAREGLPVESIDTTLARQKVIDAQIGWEGIHGIMPELIDKAFSLDDEMKKLGHEYYELGPIRSRFPAPGEARGIQEELEKDATRFRWLLNQGIQWRGCYKDGWQEGEWLYSSAPDALARIDADMNGEGVA